MQDNKSAGAGGGGGESSSRPTSSFMKSGDRQVFVVELRPGETTFVSWKKLMKDANKANNVGSSTSVSSPQPLPRPNLDSRIGPGQPAEDKGKDEPAPNRFSAVIEKIERLYMGKDSSDEGELDDIPDDDQYDTEDSFIDDAELDEYFEVDNSAIRHDGFFVNRGKLERIEPAAVPNQQLKKRRRKDSGKTHAEGEDSHVSIKHVKVAKTATGKTTLAGKNHHAQKSVLSEDQYGDVKSHNQSSGSGIPSKKKSADYSSFQKVPNGDALVSQTEAKEIERQKIGPVQSKNISNKLKDSSGPSDASHQKYHDQSGHVQPKLHSGKSLQNPNVLEPSVRPKEKNGMLEQSEMNVSEGKYPLQTTKNSHMQRKDGSSVRPKSSILEKAIKELEKMVAESRPPATENQEADTSSQAVKRRLPREIKLKLAKVARLAQASQGKISKELISRLMSILGHLIQLRTLKRNLKIMINMGLSAKQEKDNRFQQIKKDIVEMIKVRVASLDSKALERQAGSSDDFQEHRSEEKGIIRGKFNMDAELEDKICDLYDLYVDGLDEDAGPQIRRLYLELAALWPSGSMDNHGIKRAICRAKERRRALYSRRKDEEKIKRKKLLTPKTEETTRVDTGSTAQPQYMREKMATDSTSHTSVSVYKSLSNTTTVAIPLPSPLMNVHTMERLKQEKLKGTSGNSGEEVKIVDPAAVMAKKKVKRKPEQELNGSQFRADKLPAQPGDERNKSLKQSAILPPKPNVLPSTSPPTNFEQSS